MNLALFTAMRAAFAIAFYPSADPLAFGVLMKAFYVGLKFDTRLSVAMALPLLVLGSNRWFGAFSGRAGRNIWSAYMALASLIAALTYAFDFGHYAYLQARLNATALRFLYNLKESAGMIWETYPVVWICLGLGLLAALIHMVAMRLVLWTGESPSVVPAAYGRTKRALATGAAVVVLLMGIYGKAARYPLRWSDAFFDPHPFSSSLALNPVLFFMDTLGQGRMTYNVEDVRGNYDLMSGYLGVDEPDAETLDFTRRIAPRARSGKPVNVVVVLLESFAYYKCGIFGNPLDPTPNFDRIAREGILFDRFYVPAAGTARSVFALVTGIPDVETHETSSRNPLVVGQHTIIGDFHGYEKHYFLGGSLNWANIRGLLTNNIPGLIIHEEGGYEATPVDVWGISDLDLFAEANRVLRETSGPFFVVIQTSGNHRPYTIPPDNHGFETREQEHEELTGHGFISEDEYNSYRFMDHSIGHFMSLAQKEPYFENTLFVFLGDHGLPGLASHINKAEEMLLMTRFHVPLLIYGPALTGPARIEGKPASELDVLPTVAAMAGVGHTNTTLGRDLLDPRFDHARYAFTVDNQTAVTELGLISRDLCLVIKGEGTPATLHDYHSDTPREDVSDRLPDDAARMKELALAIHETAKYMTYFNSGAPAE